MEAQIPRGMIIAYAMGCVPTNPTKTREMMRFVGNQVRRAGAGRTHLCLGEGNNGRVRDVRKEVEAYETQRRIQVQP